MKFKLNSELLKELVAISETLPDGEGQLARAYYKLSVIYSQNHRQDESTHCKKQAIDLRAKVCQGEKDVAYEEETYKKLCPWMLW